MWILLFLAIALSYISTNYAYSPSSLVFETQHSPLGIPWQGPPVNVPHQLYNTSSIPFEEHTKGLKWLGMQLNFDYVLPVLNAINTTDQPLLSRREAHITVISPPEYKILETEANITIDWLNKVAKDNAIQASEFKVECVGKAIQKKNVVYQLIVSSSSLIRLREHIFKKYVSNHGNPSLFDPHAFWPHITVGYTQHDLFIEQGVYKGLNVCYRPVSFI